MYKLFIETGSEFKDQDIKCNQARTFCMITDNNTPFLAKKKHLLTISFEAVTFWDG